jgi:tRNA(Ile)-lysidine synthase
MAKGRTLTRRFAQTFPALLESAGAHRDDGVLVALSGGVDSVVLLHLLRFGDFGASWSGALTAAHLDHRVRDDDGRNAAWLRGLCHAWGVRLVESALPAAPANEAEGRALRYEWLHEAREEVGSRWILTAHHSDDQAETVLLRAVRGSGPSGLMGILPVRGDGVLRPLLPFSRRELTEYARWQRIAWREDPTNLLLSVPRNRVRHRILPELESEVAAGASQALAALSDLVREDEAAWASLMPSLLEGAGVTAEEDGPGFRIDRVALQTYHSGVQVRVLRELARRLGSRLHRAGTRAALEFMSAGRSGRRVHLGDGLHLVREFDRVLMTLEPAEDPEAESSGVRDVVIPGAGSGSGEWTSPRGLRAVVWGEDRTVDPEHVTARFSVRDLRFPLVLRAWRPGDRIRLEFGTKKIKKLLGEHRVPASRRRFLPVLVDAEDEVLWIPGLARVGREPADGGGVFVIGIENDESG